MGDGCHQNSMQEFSARFKVRKKPTWWLCFRLFKLLGKPMRPRTQINWQMKIRRKTWLMSTHNGNYSPFNSCDCRKNRKLERDERGIRDNFPCCSPSASPTSMWNSFTATHDVRPCSYHRSNRTRTAKRIYQRACNIIEEVLKELRNEGK